MINIAWSKNGGNVLYVDSKDKSKLCDINSKVWERGIESLLFKFLKVLN